MSTDAFNAAVASAAADFIVAANSPPQQPESQGNRGINWQACPELNQNITILNQVQGSTFDCAHIEVPLDYTDETSEQLQLDLFKVNATEEPVLGSVLINFGGPGGTGVENLAAVGDQMAANIGRQWNLVSWDPRGTGKTLPFDCGMDALMLPTPQGHSKRDYSGIASANLTDYFLDYGWDSAGDIADACYASMNQTGQYIGTAFTARDMMNIVDALGEDGMLRYYGWSYGTVLGSYAAAMFPDRVDRMVLDGNLLPTDYQAGHYGYFLRDADKAVEGFLDECLANKPNCSLAQFTNATSIDDMLEPLNDYLDPFAQSANSSNLAWQLYSGSTSAVFGPLYYPATWPLLADFLTGVLNGSSTTSPLLNTTTAIEPYNLGATWAVMGIRGSDALWRTNSSAEYLPQVERQSRVSSWSAQYVSLWPSARWRMDAKERYTGNFDATTKHPILYVNGEFDPVTPIANAYAASAGFKGSRVLAHSGYGHGLAVSPSKCVAGHLQAYFKDGVLPNVGSRCKPDMGPWEMAAGSGEAAAAA